VLLGKASQDISSKSIAVVKRTAFKILTMLRLYRLYGRVRYGPYHDVSERFYSQFIAEGDLCFDIGANMGSRTDIFIALGATSVAVEPQDQCLEHLRLKYRNNRGVIMVPKAVGEKEGEAQMMLCDLPSMSSLSKKWIEGIRAGGRVGNYHWETSAKVSVTTLDRLIEQYGIPAFCKIDVEGFELQVLKGLTRPIQTISFEYNPEFSDEAIACTKYLCGMGMKWFNYSIGESMRLSLAEWVTSGEMCDILINFPDKTIHSDVYATNSAKITRRSKLSR
jgi:FkbM family methyltransferase